MFYFWFHCAFINNFYFCLRKRDLEQASKDVNCKHFSPGFKIELFFQPENPNDSRNTISIRKKPTCNRCGNETSENQPSIYIENVLFHWECLDCANCGKNLAGSHNCVIKDGKPVCETCEGARFFTPCTACFRPLTGQRVVEIANLAWHPDCFRCGYCSKLFNLKNQNEYILEQNMPYCPEHRGMHKGIKQCHSPNCPNPNKAEKTVNVFGHDYHVSCFRCIECNRQLNFKEDLYVEKDGYPCCQSHEKPIFCFSCTKQVPVQQSVTIFNELWHRECLGCTFDQCNKRWETDEIENEMEMKQGKLLCKSHQYKTCTNCKSGVLPADLLEYNSYFYHNHCFTCSICTKVIDSKLSQFLFDTKKTLPFCLEHQKKCLICSKIISEQSQLLQIGNKDYHNACFRCEMKSCNNILAIGEYVCIKGHYFCSTHPQCTRCTQPIEGRDYYEDHNGIFHKNCYRCGKCNCNIDPENSGFLGNRLLCSDCHPAPKCNRCKKILDRGHLAIGGKRFHNDCFCCIICEVAFASIQDPIAVNQEGLPICQDCNIKNFTIKCADCDNPILDQRAIEALGKNYHMDCFKCENCLCLLATSFALLDNHIFCGNCARSIQATKCGVCSQLLIGDYLVSPNQKFHSHCAKCTSCSGNNAPFFKYEGLFYCRNCSSVKIPAAKQREYNKSLHQLAESVPDPRDRPTSVFLPNKNILVASEVAHEPSQPAPAPTGHTPARRTVRESIFMLKAPTLEDFEKDDLPRRSTFAEENLFSKPRAPSNAAKMDRTMSFADHRLTANKDATPTTNKNLLTKAGYLRKQGLRVKNWKRRWFVLSGNNLTYQISPEVGIFHLLQKLFFYEINSVCSQSPAIIGEIKLSKKCKLSIDVEKNLIELETVDPPRLWKFVCEKSDFQPWFKSLQQVIDG